MHKLSNEEKEIHSAIYGNSLIFFKDFVNRLVEEDNGNADKISKELLVLVVSSLQISMELALKAYIIKQEGLTAILYPDTGMKSHADILEFFKNNELHLLKFEKLKLHIAKNQSIYHIIDKEDIDIITEFQRYRNKIVHLSFNFNEGDYFDLKYDIIYFVVNILVRILSGDEDRPSEFLENVLGNKHFQRLINYQPYILAMEKLAKNNSERVFHCVVCNNKTYAKGTDYCYTCNFYGELSGEFIDCVSCKEKNSVIYDHLNISGNDNMIRGLCLNCIADCIVYKCPTCEIAHNFDCYLDSCNNENGCVNS